MSHLPVGAIVEEYRIERSLGAGGFGVAYLVRDERLGKRFALKEYFPAQFAERSESSIVQASPGCIGDYESGKESFLREARILARFQHRNIVAVTRVFEANNTAYIVEEYVDGLDIKDWLGEIRRSPTQEELDLLLEPILNALATVHANDILHGDLAPDNIRRRTDGTPVLLDFGAAREEFAQRTRTVTSLVKAGYSPPEQYSTHGKNQGRWSDIYSLGATLYRAVAGKRPDEAMDRVLKDELLAAARAANGSYRQGFLAAIDWALRIRPEERPQKVDDWRKVLFEQSPQGLRQIDSAEPSGERILQAGTTVGGYKIEEELGASGYAISYRVRDPGLAKLFVLKEYFPVDIAMRDATSTIRAKQGKGDDFATGMQRFIEEARHLSRLRHPNVAGVARVFEANNTAYVVLDCLGGSSLREWLHNLKRPPTQTELDILLSPILDALSMIHRNGLLHCEISPDNIQIRADGSPALLNLSNTKEALARRIGVLPSLVGVYSPPEQCSTNGEHLGPWTDLYALAATIYRAVAERPPDAATDRLVADKLIPAAQVAQVSYRPQFLAAIDWALHLNPRERPQNTEEWSRALAPAASPERASANSGSQSNVIDFASVAIPPRNHGLVPPASLGAPVAPKGAEKSRRGSPRPRLQFLGQPVFWRAIAICVIGVVLFTPAKYWKGLTQSDFSGGPMAPPPIAAIPKTPTTGPSSEQLTTAPLETLCQKALNWQRSDWDPDPPFAPYIAEAQRRGAGVETCRQKLAALDASLTVGGLCRYALNGSSAAWDESHLLAHYVVEAKRRGLSVADCRAQSGLAPPATPPIAKSSSPSAPQAQALPDFAAETKLLMTKYWAISSDQSQDGSALEPLYADTLTFYSGNKTRSEVIGLKIAYFRDWNVRKYTSHDIQVNCQERLCTAEGLVDWELVSESRRVMSTGRSTFSFIVDWAAGEGKIVNENGAVLNREAHKI